MKRICTALLLALILMLPLTACKQQEAGPLRILVDLDNRSNQVALEHEIDKLLEMAKENGCTEEIEVEYVPEKGEERKGALTRLRTEVMAGRGPDLFLISEQFFGDPLFPYPEKSMLNGLFLSLDKYMEKSQFTQWDQQNQTILSAGKTDKGQQIIPLTYSVLVTCFRKADAAHTPSAENSWDDMANSSDLAERISCIYSNSLEQNLGVMGAAQDRPGDALGKLADFEREELLFTEEDLAEGIKTRLKLMDLCEQGEFSSLPAFYQTPLYARFNDSAAHAEEPIAQDEPLTFIPRYSKGGGIAACVRDYAAISNDTKHAEDAFLILDLLMSRESQQKSDLFTKWLTNAGTSGSLPLDDALMSEEYPVPYLDGKNWSLTPENFEALRQVTGQISSVNFSDSLYATLHDLENECYQIYYGYSEGDIDEQIKEAYRVLEMSIKES